VKYAIKHEPQNRKYNGVKVKWLKDEVEQMTGDVYE